MPNPFDAFDTPGTGNPFDAFDNSGSVALVDLEPPNSEPPADKPDHLRPSDFPPLSQAERSKTGQLYDIPAWLQAESAGTENDPINQKPLIPAEYVQPALRASADVMTGGLAEAYRHAPIVGPIYKGLESGTAEAEAGFTTPQNIAMLPLGGVGGKVGQVALGAAFEAEAIRSFPALWKQYQETTDPQEKARLASTMAIGLGLPAMAPFHAGLEGKSNAAPRSAETLETQSPEEIPPTIQTPSVGPDARSIPVVRAEEAASPDFTNPPVQPQGRKVEASFLPNEEPAKSTDEKFNTSTLKWEPKTDRDYWFDGLDLRESVINGLRRLGADPAKTDLPSADAFTSGKDFFYAMRDADGRMRASGAKAAGFILNPENKPVSSGGQGQTAEPQAVRQLPATPEAPTPQGEAAPSGQASVEAPKVTSTKNEVTDAERASRDIAPAEEVAQRDFGQVWDEAAKVAQDDPNAGDRLVEELNAKPRAVTDQENALLLRKQIETQTEFDNAVKGVNDAPDEATRAEAQIRLSAARDDLQNVYDANRKAGTETGRGLNARKMLAAEDYSLAKMEARKRAANGGQPLNPRQLKEVADLHAKIAELQGKVDAHEQGAAQRATFEKLLTESKAEARQAVKAKRSVTDFLDEQAAKARERLRSKAGRLNVGLDPTTLADYAVIGASHIARGTVKFAEWSGHMVREFGETIKPHLQDIWEKARQLHAANSKILSGEDSALKRYKTGLERRTAEIQKKLEAQDFKKAERQKTVLDRQAMEMKAKYQRLKDQFDAGVERDRLKNLPMSKRMIDGFVKAERAMKLTGITTLGKLGAAGVTRLVTTPVEEAVGGLLGKLPILNRVAEAAPREGGLSLKAEALAPTKGVARGIANIPRILKGERTNEEALYGKPQAPKSALDIPQNVHGAIKSPFKEAERVRSEVKRGDFAKRSGQDLSDPAVKEALGKAANQDAQRAIFMQDNILSDFWRQGIRSLETSKRFPTGGYILAKVGQFLLPIVKVPTNVAFEAGVHIGGTVTATGKLISVMSRGLKNVKPEEADMIMRHYKKGMIGAALFLTGYFNAKNVGGFYQQGDKRKEGDLKWGQARVAGVTVPRWMMHAPAFIVLQAGATAYRSTHTNKPTTAMTGAMAVAQGITHEIPFMAELGVIDSTLASNYEGTKARGRILQGATVPQASMNIAEWLDQKDANGDPIKRYPQSELDYAMMGIPGLRERVPASKPHR